MDTKQAKQRFGIIGNTPQLERAIDVALQVAPTDISILVFGVILFDSFSALTTFIFLIDELERTLEL